MSAAIKISLFTLRSYDRTSTCDEWILILLDKSYYTQKHIDFYVGFLRITWPTSRTYGIVKSSLSVPIAPVFGCSSSSFTAPTLGTAPTMPKRVRIASPASTTGGGGGPVSPIMGST